MFTEPLRGRAVAAGLLAAVVVVYLCLVGMVETFTAVRLVEGWVTLGRALVVLPAGLAGLLLVRPRTVGGAMEAPAPAAGVSAGAVVGLICGAVIAVGVVVVNAFPDGAVRNIFSSVTTGLITILTLGKSTAPGLILLVAMLIVTGALGAGLGVAPRTVRRPVTIALLVVLLMGMLQNVVRTALIQLGVPVAWLFSVRFGGLTLAGSVVMFAAVTVVAGMWAVRGAEVRDRLRIIRSEGAGDGRRTALGLGIMLLILLLALLPVLLGDFLSAVLGRVGIFLLMGLGLNIVVGYAGLLDLGYVAFFAVGAYATGVLTAAANSGSTLHPGLNFFEAIPIVIVIAVITGLLIGAPVLRLRGDYLALVTLGFGEIARVLVTSDWLKPLLGGAQGLIAIPAPSIGGVSFRDPRPFYYLALAFCLVAIFVAWRLSDSRVGRAWSAMREDEQVAEAMGVSTVKYKLLAFATGAAIGSMSGALFAVQIGSLSPASFTVLVSITALAIVILGGMGSIPGVVLAAFALIGIPGFLTEFQQYQLLIYGAVLIGIMILKPEGLIPNVRRSRELHEEEREQDAWLSATAEPAAALTVGADHATERPVE
jgi:branched-chain amino acid transport system permease protein